MGIVSWIILIVCSFVSCTTMADVAPDPCMGQFPLHRIGLEIVLEAVAATAGGSALLRWVLKRGWKHERDLTQEERMVLRERLRKMLPDLKKTFSQWINGYKVSVLPARSIRGETKDCIELFLHDNKEVRRSLTGIPIEWIATALCDKWDFDSYWATDQEEEEWNVYEWENDEDEWEPKLGSPRVLNWKKEPHFREWERQRKVRLMIVMSCLLLAFALSICLAVLITWWLIILVPVAFIAAINGGHALSDWILDLIQKFRDTKESSDKRRDDNAPRPIFHFDGECVAQIGDEWCLYLTGLQRAEDEPIKREFYFPAIRTRVIGSDVRVPNTDISELEISITSFGPQVKVSCLSSATVVDGKELAQGDVAMVSDGSEILLGVRSSVKIVVKKVPKPLPESMNNGNAEA